MDQTRTFYGIEVDLSKEETISFLDTCKYRPDKIGGVEVFYNESWLRLCRTSLIDDISTFHSSNVRELIIFYRDRCVYGARVKKQAFCIIDRITDG